MKYKEGELIKEDGHWMWYHVCSVEKTDMFIGKGEKCSWCGAEPPLHIIRNTKDVQQYLKDMKQENAHAKIQV